MSEHHLTLTPSPEDVQPPDSPDEPEQPRPSVAEPYQPKKYKRRPGTVNFGKEYEWKIAALLSLRCIFSEVEDMWMATNIDKASDFDDIILTLNTSEGEVVSYMIQLKHENRSRTVTEGQLKSLSGDFSLCKYFDSINIFHNSGNIIDLANFDNIYFVLFTNRAVNDLDFLVRNDDELIKIINTKSGQSYFIDRAKLHLETENFCINFRFLASQLNVVDLEWQIEDELCRRCNSASLHLVDPKAVVENYVKFIREWYNGNMGGHYYLTKEIVSQKMCEVLLNQYEINFKKRPFLFNNSPQNLTWEEIIDEKEIRIFHYSELMEDFLINYIGSELQRHFTGLDIDTWNKPMSREEETLFYQENADLRNEMQRRICKFGGLTAYDLYNCLAGLKKIPKLLVVSSFEDCQSILNILRVFGQPFKIILLMKGNAHCTAPTAHIMKKILKEVIQRFSFVKGSATMRARGSNIFKFMRNKITKVVHTIFLFRRIQDG